MNTSQGQVKTVSAPKKRRTLQGTVVSTRMAKTIVVRVDRTLPHPIYGKFYTRSEKFKVHDEHAKAKVGDVVEFEETRPLSKQKCWRYIRTIKSTVVSESDLITQPVQPTI
jgi:small subunit ribosomal protein S17